MKLGVFLIIFTLFWSAIVGAFDVIIFGGMARQLRALDYPATEGRVLSSQVTSQRGRKGGTTHGVAVHYEYEVAGRKYSGQRYQYNDWNTSDFSWAQAVVAAHPRGAATKVFYNPRDPVDALLVPGIDGGQLLIALFLTPFNLVMLGLWRLPLGWLWRKCRYAETGGVKVRRALGESQVLLPPNSPAIIVMATMGIQAFALMFILAACYGSHPPLNVMLAVWLGVLGTGLGVGLWAWRRARSGRWNLVIDEKTSTLHLPLTFGRKAPRSVSFSEVTAVELERVAHRGRRGGTTYSYAPTLRLRGPESGSPKIADWYDEARAEAFAEWLTKTIRPDLA